MKAVMDMRYACNAVEQVYAERMDMLFGELQSEYLPVFVLAYFCYATPYDRLQVLSSLKIWPATTKFESKDRTDK